MHIITDDNYLDFVDASIEAGRFGGLIPRNYQHTPYGSIPHTRPFAADFPLIPESEWPARIQAMQGRFIGDIYTGTPEEDYQNGMPFCWSFSLSQAIKGARDVAGLPHVDLLAESLGECVNWRNAGYYCGKALEYEAEHGMCDRSFSPKRYSLSPSTWKEGWQNEALNHRALEWWELGTRDMRAEAVTALLSGFGIYVGLNKYSHAMWFSKLVVKDGKVAVWTPNTHGPGEDWLLTGSNWIPDEAYVIRTSTFSDS